MTDSYRLQPNISSQPPFTSRSILLSLRYAYPAIVFLYYILATSAAVCTLQTRSAGHKHNRLRLILSLLLLAVSTYLLQLVTLLVRCLIFKSIIPSQDTIISLLSCVLVYGVQFAGLADSEKPVWYPYVGSLWIALLAEPIIETLAVLTWAPASMTYVQLLDVATVATRYLAFLTILVIYYGLPRSSARENGSEAEQQALIPKEDGQRQAGPLAGVQSLDADGYGSVPDDSADDARSTESPESEWERRNREAREQMEKRLAEQGSWLAYARSFMVTLCHPLPMISANMVIVPALLPLHMACQ
jgi:hypothetical protein